MAKIAILFVIIASILGAHGQTDPYQKRLALIIGNSKYQAGMELKNPGNDAKSMAFALENLGFDVILRENLSLEGLKTVAQEFGKKLKAYDVGLFYYAGHGLQYHGQNYLVPVEANMESEDHVDIACLRAENVLNLMSIANAKVNLVILDACRNNPYERSWSRSVNGAGLAPIQATRGTLIAYATAPGSTASDGSGENGLYTSAILNHIGNENLTIEQLFRRVRTEVEDKSKNQQHPWESTSLTGDDLFLAKGFINKKSNSSSVIRTTIDPAALKEANQLYLSGVQKFNQKMFSDALYDLSQSLELNPYSAETQYSMGRLHLELKMTDQALADFSRSIALKPEMGIAYVSRGLLLFTKGNFQGSADDFETAARIAPQNAEFRYSWGISLYEMGAYEKAINAFSQTLALNPMNINSWYYRAMCYYALKRLKPSVEDFDEVIRMQPTNNKALLYRALALAQLGDDRAMPELDSVIKRDSNPFAYCERGILHFRNNNLVAAGVDLNYAINKDNSQVKAIYWKGKWFYELKDPIQALNAMEICLSIDSAYAEALAWKGFIQTFPVKPVDLFKFAPSEKLGKREREISIRNLEKAVKLDPSNINILLLKSQFLIGIGNLNEAGNDLSKIIESNPESQPALFLLGRLKYATGDYGSASILLTKSIRSSPTAESYHWRGECGIQLKLLEQAESDFENSLRINPKNSQSFFRLMETVALRNDIDKMLKGYEDALGQGLIGRTEIFKHKMETFLKIGQPKTTLEIGNQIISEESISSMISYLRSTKSTSKRSTLDGNTITSLELFNHENGNIIYLMAKAHRDLGDRKSGVQLTKLLQQIDPGNQAYKDLASDIRQLKSNDPE